MRFCGRVSVARSICGLAVAVSLMFLAPSSASALEHPFIEDFGSVSEPSFIEAQGMAIDQATGDLLVLDRDAKTLSRWHSDGTPAEFSALSTNVIGPLNFGTGSLKDPGEVQVAVDSSCALHEPPLSELTTPTCEEFDPANGNIYVAEVGAKIVTIFDEDGSPLGQLTGYNDSSAKTFNAVCGVAVDPSGNVFVGDFFSGTVHKYEPAANPPVNGDNVANFPFAQNCNIAAGAGTGDGFLFPVQLNGKVSKLDSTTGTEKYEVDSGPTTTATVDPTTGTLYTASGSEVKEFDVIGEAEATEGLPIAPGGEKVGGIAVDGDTGRIYVSRKGNANIEVWGKAVDLPKAITESASVIGDTVTMRGVVNANEGPPTSCVFQYVEAKEKGFKGATSVPCTPAGSFTGNTNEAVSAEVSGLAEGTYRFRLVASNEDGSKAGAMLFFTISKQIGLPDGRAYEMVSPSQKAGEVIPPEPETQLGGSCGDCLPGVNDLSMPMQTHPDGSSVLYLGQPFAAGLAAGPNEYLAPRSSTGWGTQGLSAPTTTGRFLAFSEKLSQAVLAQADPPLSPQAPIRGGKGFPNLYLQANGGLEPVIATEPPNREPGDFEVSFGGANAGTILVPAFGHVAFEANDALTEAVGTIAPAAPEVEVGPACSLPGAECNLYEWEGGELRLVNVLPGNVAAAGGAVIGAGRMLASFPAAEQANIENAISDDGSRIFWSSEQTGEVYVRVEGEETLEIPGAGSCKEIEPAKERACFLTASPDGSTVLLSDGTIYELNGAETAYEATIDLTETKGGFEGILGAAEDLSRIYFVDTAALTAESEENENGEHAETDELNLYGWEGGESSFIAILALGDQRFGLSNYGALAASPSQRTAQVTLNGSYLAFMSLAPLTGYDNTRRGGGKCRSSSTPACREVFVYAADSENLACASCNPSGEQPLGDSNLTLIRPQGPFRQPGNLSREGEGRLFFESLDALVPRDVNASTQDVYEWEPNGVGSCKRAQGCVSLISSGQSPNDSMFVDSSDSGNDAFFITREKLLPRDKNDQLDLYDARVGGGFEEAAPAPCSPEACAGPIASPPAQPSAASNEVTGPGNPKPKRCKPGFVKKQGKCVKKKPKKKKKAADNRRGSR